MRKAIIFLLLAIVAPLGAGLFIWGVVSQKQIPSDSPVCTRHPPPSVHTAQQWRWCKRLNGTWGTFEEARDDLDKVESKAKLQMVSGAALVIVALRIAGVPSILWKNPMVLGGSRNKHPSGPRNRPLPPEPPAPDDYRLLLLMCGSRETAESLIAMEQRLLPRANRATLIAKAIQRLRRDRDRQG